MDNSAQTAPSVESDGQREFAAIITAHQSVLLRYVTRIVKDAGAAQDVVQETFIKLFLVGYRVIIGRIRARAKAA
jgi:DNA-directed RNA polymerase specialized sigma24 family protein